MLTLSSKSKVALEKKIKEPQIVLCIDGVENCYGSAVLLAIWRIGDPDLFIGAEFIGGYRSVENQSTLVSFDGSSQSIKQQLDQDKGKGSSVSSLQIALIDKANEATELITPEFLVDDILGRKAEVYVGFGGVTTTSFPEDYTKIFVGMIDDVTSAAGLVTLNIAHPDAKKRQTIYNIADTKLDGAITNLQTTITVDDTSKFLVRTLGPDLTYDADFKSYVLIDEELIEYTGTTATTFTGLVRGQLGTFPNPHSDEAEVKAFYRFNGNVSDLALKVMLSYGGYYQENLEVEAIGKFGPTVVANSVWFSGINAEEKYGLTEGDYITVASATNGANNFTLRVITSVIYDGGNSYVTVDGAALIIEEGSPATASLRSKYDTFPQGLGMTPDEVDVAQHEYLKQLFLQNINYDLYVKETIENAKDFIEDQLYKPAACYSIPRKTRSSMGFHVGPIPSQDIKKFDETNVVKPSEIKLRRGTNKNFYNTIIYRFEEDTLEDKFLRGEIIVSGDSTSRIPSVGTKALVIDAKGFRDSLSGTSLASSLAQRRLNRYKFGAEYIEGLKTTFGDGFAAEIGDVIILDPTNLKISNTRDGTREKEATFFEIINKSLNIKTGEVTLDIVDTNFADATRYGLISPSSRISAVTSQQEFTIESIYHTDFDFEWEKWNRFRRPTVAICNSDRSIIEFATIERSTSNLIKLTAPVGITINVGYFMMLTDYNSSTDELRLRYAFMKDTDFDDGKSQYQIL